MLNIAIPQCKQIIIFFYYLKLNHKNMFVSVDKKIDRESPLNSEEKAQVHENRAKKAKNIQTKSFRESSDSKQQESEKDLKKSDKKKKQWTYENEKLLIELYVKYGNKWKELAGHFQNMNGSFLKNKFYSRLRKGLRTINYLIRQFFSDEWENFDCDIVFKLVNCAANKYDFSSKCPLGKKIEKFEFFPEKIAHRIYMLSFFKKPAAKGFMKRQAKNESEIKVLVGDINLIDERIEPKRSNRKKTTKVGQCKIQLKQEKIVISNHIKISAQDYKDNLNGFLSQQSPLQRKWSLRPLREQMAKIQIVGINSNHPIKPQNPMIEGLEHSSQNISEENKNQKLSSVSHIRCSYIQIPSIQDLQEFNLNNYHNALHQHLNASQKSESHKNVKDQVNYIAEIEGDGQKKKVDGQVEFLRPFERRNYEFSRQAINEKY